MPTWATISYPAGVGERTWDAERRKRKARFHGEDVAWASDVLRQVCLYCTLNGSDGTRIYRKFIIFFISFHKQGEEKAITLPQEGVIHQEMTPQLHEHDFTQKLPIFEVSIL